MGWWLSVSGWIYFDLSFTGALFYHVFLTVSIKEASVNPFMSLLYIIIPVRMRIKGCWKYLTVGLHEVQIWTTAY